MEGTDTHLRHTPVLVRFDQKGYFMALNIFVLKRELNGEIVVRFFFVGYTCTSLIVVTGSLCKQFGPRSGPAERRS